jgi:hypothetical protein
VLRCAKVKRGGRKPLLVKFTSSPAEGSGVLLLSLIPTWANKVLLNIRSKAITMDIVFMILSFGLFKNSFRSFRTNEGVKIQQKIKLTR